MRQLVIFCAAIGISAVFAPQFLTDFTAQRKASADRPGVSSTWTAKVRTGRKAKRSVAHSGNVVEIAAAHNGHFLVNADVNLRPVHFVVDTGASVVALRQSDAETAGIFLNASDFRVPVSTANGTAYGARVRLDNVAIEGIDVNGVSALVLPDGLLGISLLGNSFLNRLERFQVSNNVLLMEN